MNGEETKIKHVLEGFDFLEHTVRLAPSRVTGKMSCFYLPASESRGLDPARCERVASAPTAPETAGPSGSDQSYPSRRAQLFPNRECQGSFQRLDTDVMPGPCFILRKEV